MAILLFPAFLRRNLLISLGKLAIPPRLLLTLVTLGAQLVKLLVVVAIAFEAADMIEAPLIGIADRKLFDAQIEGGNTLLAAGSRSPLVLLLFAFPVRGLGRCVIVDKRAEVVAMRIASDRHISKALGRHFHEGSTHIGKLFLAPFAPGGKLDGVPLDLEIHGRVDQGEEAMARSDSGETRSFPGLHPSEKALHGAIQAEVDLLEQLAIHPIQFRVVGSALFQCFLGGIGSRPALARTQAHHPPVVEPSAFALHPL